MPVLFEKETLRPGVYWKNGRRVIVTRQDCRDYFDFAKNLHETTNLKIPLVLEHPAADRQADAEGFPLPAPDLDEKAESLRRTVGASYWNDARNRINENGACVFVYEAKDQGVATQLQSQAIEFVSPELRPNGWTDGKGTHYPKAITHVALTHRPIQIDQTPGFVALADDSPVYLSSLAGPICLSQSELVPGETLEDIALAKTTTPPAATKVKKPGATPGGKLLRGQLENFLNQLASEGDDETDDDPAKPGKGSPPPAPGETPPPAALPAATPKEDDNHDMPKGEGDKKQIEALLAHLREAGFVLPADTSKENLVQYLLVAVMTKNAADAESEATDRDDTQGAAQELSPMGISQMSTNDKVTPADARRRLIGRIQGCKSIPAATRDDLLVRTGMVQFSDDGNEKVAGGISIADTVAMFEQQAVQFSEGSPQSNLAARIKAARTAGKVQPGVADQLLAKVGVVQFGDDGREVVPAGGISLSDVVTSLERSANMVGALLSDQTSGYQLSDAIDNPGHPKGDAFTTGQTIIQHGDPRAKKIAQDFIRRQGGKTRSEAVTQPHANAGAM